MSTWWDNDAKKHRSTLVYKVFYVWGWPAARWIMFNCISSERAHTFAVHWAIPIIYRIDRVWCFASSIFWLAVLLPLIVVIRLLTLLPGFTCEIPEEDAPAAPARKEEE